MKSNWNYKVNEDKQQTEVKKKLMNWKKEKKLPSTLHNTLKDMETMS